MPETDPFNLAVFSDSMMLKNYLVLRLAPETADALVTSVQQFWMDEYDQFLPPEMVKTALAGWFEREVGSISDSAKERLFDPKNEDARFFQALLEDLQKRQTGLETARLQNATIALPKSRKARDVPSVPNPSDKSLAEKNIFNGFRRFSAKRFAAMIAYIAARGRQMYKTKLNKLLFYRDFVNFYLRGSSISGTIYILKKLPPRPKKPK